MSLDDPVIITCAISGALAGRERCPAIPYTPARYAAEAALALGGSIRVGLEDNRYLPEGAMARSNGELVARARRMTHDAGRAPATVAEARAMLGAPRR